jgi:predicted PurR-regulated permease PerM
LGNPVERLTVGDLSERFGENVKRIKVGGSEEAVAVMGGSLLAGSLLMLLSGSFVVDITGGVMASLGVLLGMGLIVRKKKKLKNELLKILQREVGERIKKEINKALDKTLEETLLVMRNYLTDRLQLLEKEKERIQKAKETLMSNISQLKKFNP